VISFTTNSVVFFTPTNTVSALGMDTCQGRTVASAANCLGPVAIAASVAQAYQASEPLVAILGVPYIARGVLNLSFFTEQGRTYTVQYKNTLSDATWTDLETIIGTGDDMSIPDPVAPQQPTRFYRIVPTKQ